MALLYIVLLKVKAAKPGIKQVVVVSGKSYGSF